MSSTRRATSDMWIVRDRRRRRRGKLTQQRLDLKGALAQHQGGDASFRGPEGALVLQLLRVSPQLASPPRPCRPAPPPARWCSAPGGTWTTASVHAPAAPHPSASDP